jgi:hypothetical protein
MSDPKAQLIAQMAVLITERVSNPLVKAEVAAVPDIIDALMPAINSIMHSTNNEPWYQSKVTWGALITAGGLALTAAGVTVSATYEEILVSLAVTLSGPLVTLWGRWRAKKPLIAAK